MSETTHNIIVPREVFQKGILDVIEDRTGRKIPLKAFDRFDESVFGKLAGIKKVKVTIIPRLFHRVFCLKGIYNKTIVSAWLIKEGFN